MKCQLILNSLMVIRDNLSYIPLVYSLVGYYRQGSNIRLADYHLYIYLDCITDGV